LSASGLNSHPAFFATVIRLRHQQLHTGSSAREAVGAACLREENIE
jgi:hypothetical protein